MRECKHGVILYGNRCISCEREKDQITAVHIDELVAIEKLPKKIVELARRDRQLRDSIRHAERAGLNYENMLEEVIIFLANHNKELQQETLNYHMRYGALNDGQTGNNETNRN